MPDPNPPSADTTRFVWLPDPALSAASNAAAFMRVLGVSDYGIWCATAMTSRSGFMTLCSGMWASASFSRTRA